MKNAIQFQAMVIEAKQKLLMNVGPYVQPDLFVELIKIVDEFITCDDLMKQARDNRHRTLRDVESSVDKDAALRDFQLASADRNAALRALRGVVRSEP